MQDVVPSAVRIADAIDTINCVINLIVSFFVIALFFLISHSLIFRSVGAEAPSALTLVEVITSVAATASVATAVASAA